MWNWTSRENDSYVSIIKASHSAPVLKHFDPDQQTFLYTDASNFAVGGWIGQETDKGIQPIVFYSRKMNDHELKYPVHEQELLAIVTMIDHHGVYLSQGAIIKSDHKPLVWLQSQPLFSSRQVRWVMKLQEFNLKIEYLPGKFNNVADYLSRQPSLAPKCHYCQKRILDFKSEVSAGDCYTVSRDGSGEICIIDLTNETKGQEHMVASFHDRDIRGLKLPLKV